METPTVFLSYSHRDERLMKRLVSHLGVAERQGRLRVCIDRDFRAGDDWFKKLVEALVTARVAMVLVSPDYLTSDFVMNEEVPRILELREKNGLTVFPVIVRDCAWKTCAWLARFQARPWNGRSLASFRGSALDRELSSITCEVLEILENGGVATVSSSALHSRGPAPFNLPTPPPDFTGREAELWALSEALKQGGAVICSVRGMGGIGKTALASKVAHEALDRFPDAQLYLNLQGASSNPLSPTEVMKFVIRSFEPAARFRDDEVEIQRWYRTLLHGKKALLFLDNARSQEQIEPLIPPVGVALLVTSRWKFSLSGNLTWDLDELSPGDAVSLLKNLIPRLKSNEALSLAQHCGCLPLALRLAGSWLDNRKDLSAARYIRQLERFRGKKVELIDASLSLSYNLLPPERQLQWRRLGVFSDSFDAQAAMAVWVLKELQADTVLGELITSSLLEADTETGRYRLHDLARDFTLHRLDPKELQGTQARHARYYHSILERAEVLFREGGESISAGLQIFSREWAHIRAGQEWSAQQASTIEEAAELCVTYPLVGPNLLDLQIQPRERIAWFEKAVEAARARRDRFNEGKILGSLGNAYRTLGECRRAIEFHEQHLSITREIGDQHGEGEALSNLGLAYADLGEYQTAIKLYKQHLAIAQHLSDRRGEGVALGHLGIAYWALKECKRAINLYEKCLAIAREFGDRRSEGRALCNLGLAYADLGEFRYAIELYEQHLMIARELGDRRGEGHALGNLGSAYRDLGEFQGAIDLYEQRLAIAREFGDRRGEAIVSWNLGETWEKIGRLDRAADLMQVLVNYERELGHVDAERHASEVDAIRARLKESEVH